MCERWSQEVCFHLFSGLDYFQLWPPFDPTQIGRFRQLLGEEGVGELLCQTIQSAFRAKLVIESELENVIIDSTVQIEAVTNPTDYRLANVSS